MDKASCEPITEPCWVYIAQSWCHVLPFFLESLWTPCPPGCWLLVWFELGLNLPQRSDVWRASCWVLCFLGSLFSWERNKSTQLSARFLWLPCPHCAAAASQEQMSQQGSRLLCWHCVFPPFSHSISLLQSSHFLPFVFDCVEKIGQASIAHFKNEMLGYIALQ